MRPNSREQQHRKKKRPKLLGSEGVLGLPGFGEAISTDSVSLCVPLFSTCGKQTTSLLPVTTSCLVVVFVDLRSILGATA